MPNAAHKAMLKAAGAAVLISTSVPSAAQVDPRIVLNILRECAKIGDVTARVACYDNNVRTGDPSAAAAVPPPRESAQRNNRPTVASEAAGGARKSDRLARSPALPTDGLGRIEPVVTAVAERSPGAYSLTLQDGAQWDFAEDLPLSYQAPHPGSRVEIERGALGGYRLRFDGQQPVRVRRVR